MANALEKKTMQFFGSESMQCIHALRLELYAVLEKKKSLQQGLQAAKKISLQLLAIKEINQSVALSQYSVLLTELLELLFAEENDRIAGEGVEVLVKSLNPLAFSLQTYSNHTLDSAWLKNTLELPANELRQIFSLPLVCGDTALHIVAENLAGNITELWSGSNHHYDQVKISASSVLISFDQLVSLDQQEKESIESSLGGNTEERDELKNTIFNCLEQLDSSIKEINSATAKNDTSLISCAPRLLKFWATLALNNSLDPALCKAGLQSLKLFSQCDNPGNHEQLVNGIVALAYFLSFEIASQKSIDAAISDQPELAALFELLGFTKPGHNAALESVGRSNQESLLLPDSLSGSVRLSMPDLETINALVENVCDSVQSIKDLLNGCEFDDSDSLQEELSTTQKESLKNIRATVTELDSAVQFLPTFYRAALVNLANAASNAFTLFENDPNENSVNQFAESILLIETKLRSVLHGEEQNSSGYALLVQIKALLNQLEAFSRREAKQLGLLSNQQLVEHNNRDTNAAEKLRAISKNLVGVVSFVDDSMLVLVVNAINTSVIDIFSCNPKQDSLLKQSDCTEDIDFLLNKIDCTQRYVELLITPTKNQDVDLSVALSALVQDQQSTNEIAAAQILKLDDVDSIAHAEAGETLDQVQVADNGESITQNSEFGELFEERLPSLAKRKLIDDIDDEIAEIFLEEAEEVLEQLRVQQIQLNNNKIFLPEQQEAWFCLNEIRRFFHTLKGSGRMAGAAHLGEFAWAVESMLNRILEGAISCDLAHTTALNKAIDSLPALLDSFCKREYPAIDYEVVEENIKALLENRALESESLSAVQESGTANYITSVNETDSTKPDDVEALNEVESVDAIAVEGVGEQGHGVTVEDIDSDAAKAQGGEISTTQPGDVAEFRTRENDALFSSELSSSTEYLRDLITHASKDGKQDNALLKSALIKMHALAGSAKLVSYREAGQIAQIAEQHLEVLNTLPNLPENTHGLVESYCDLLDGLVERGDDTQQAVAEALDIRDKFDSAVEHIEHAQSVREAIQACKLLFDVELVLDHWRVNKVAGHYFDILVCELGMLRESLALPVCLLQLVDRLGKIYLGIEGRALNYELHSHLRRAHDELENGLSAVLTEQEPASPVTLKILDGIIHKLGLSATKNSGSSDSDQEPAIKKELPNTPTQATVEVGQVDHEILAIFIEELEELDEELAQQINAWQRDPDNTNLLKTILRPLHTLKGSARMAGVGGLADEAHEIESNIQRLVDSPSISASSLAQIPQQLENLRIQCKLVGQSGNREEFTDALRTKSVERRTRDRAPKINQNQMLRLPASTLEKLSNLAGENNVSRSIIEQSVSEFNQGYEEIESTLGRLQEQIRRLEIESEAQIAFGKERAAHDEVSDFDPLEFDRYSKLQQISRSLVESCSDLKDLHTTLKDKTRSVETMLIQQSRIGRELHMSLQQTRTVPLSKVLLPRVRKTLSALSKELGKPVELSVLKVDGELDRNVVERLTAPIEHILRNAIDHGLESEQERIALGKPAKGLICVDIFRDGSELVIEIKDDGKGIDVNVIRQKALQRGLISKEDAAFDEKAIQSIFAPGFSTAEKVTQISGRGVGLDVVSSELAGMGGAVRVSSKLGEGTLFRLQIPFSVAMSRALLVTVANETLAISIDSIVGIVRLSSFELEEQYNSDDPKLFYGNREYEFNYLGKLLMGVDPEYNLEHFSALPVLLARTGDQLTAIQVDTLVGSREITVKTLSQKFSPIAGVAGATILGNGKVVTILDLPDLIEKRQSHSVSIANNKTSQTNDGSKICHGLVVDDSVTVRKVTSRLLERQHIEVSTAKDGQEALDLLENCTPDFVLLDIEMPRVDGFEVLERMSRDERLQQIPVIVISSRSGEKHQTRAKDLGANAFVGKPYQDEKLLNILATHCSKFRDRGGAEAYQLAANS